MQTILIFWYNTSVSYNNDVCKDNNLLISIVQDGPYPKGRRPFIARDGSRFQNDRGRQTEIILVSVYMILYFMCSPTARTWEGVRANIY